MFKLACKSLAFSPDDSRWEGLFTYQFKAPCIGSQVTLMGRKGKNLKFNKLVVFCQLSGMRGKKSNLVTECDLYKYAQDSLN